MCVEIMDRQHTTTENPPSPGNLAFRMAKWAAILAAAGWVWFVVFFYMIRFLAAFHAAGPAGVAGLK